MLVDSVSLDQPISVHRPSTTGFRTVIRADLRLHKADWRDLGTRFGIYLRRDPSKPSRGELSLHADWSASYFTIRFSNQQVGSEIETLAIAVQDYQSLAEVALLTLELDWDHAANLVTAGIRLDGRAGPQLQVPVSYIPAPPAQLFPVMDEDASLKAGLFGMRYMVPSGAEIPGSSIWVLAASALLVLSLNTYWLAGGAYKDEVDRRWQPYRQVEQVARLLGQDEPGKRIILAAPGGEVLATKLYLRMLSGHRATWVSEQDLRQAAISQAAATQASGVPVLYVVGLAENRESIESWLELGFKSAGSFTRVGDGRQMYLLRRAAGL